MARSVLDASDVIEDILRDSDSDLSELSESEYEHVDDIYDDEVDQASDDDANQSPAAAVVNAEWERNDNADAYVPIWCPSYAKSSGPELPDSLRRSEPIDYFYLLFPEQCFELIVKWLIFMHCNISTALLKYLRPLVSIDGLIAL